MPYNVLLIPLLGGYYFLSNFLFFKYKYQRISSQRLLLNSALAGLLIGVISILLRTISEQLFPTCFEQIASFFNGLRLGNQRYLVTMLVGLALTIGLTKTLNWFILNSQFRNLPIKTAIKNYGNELEQLCYDSIVGGFALQVTLKNEKVYIGFIDKAPIPSQTNYLLFTPLYSGFRDPETKRMQLNVSYFTVINELIEGESTDKIEIINVVIKQDEILTMSPHDPEVYTHFINSISE